VSESISELRHTRDFARDLNSWITFRESILAPAVTNPAAVHRAAERCRDGLTAVMRLACQELAPANPPVNDHWFEIAELELERRLGRKLSRC
jgi:hypothetical protein